MCVPKIKISETFEKITNPGRKKIYRVYNENGQSVADLLTSYDEEPDMTNAYRYVDPEKSWEERCFNGCHIKELQQPVIKNGKRVIRLPTLTDIREYVRKQLTEEVWEEEQRFENPHKHYLDMSPKYYEMKMNLLHEVKNQQKG